jgi:hypothetical protein
MCPKVWKQIALNHWVSKAGDRSSRFSGGKGWCSACPLAVTTDEIKQKFGGIEGLPTTLLYDRQGVLRTKVVGFEYTENIDAALRPLL